MSQLLIHPTTKSQLDHFMAQPSHTVSFSGAVGSGKGSLAKQLAEQVLQLPSDGLGDYPYAVAIKPYDDKAIGIEIVRELQHFLALKVPGKLAINRVVILEEAHKLTLEAQNALLKTLEEPPLGTLIIMTVANSQALLPTIRSRSLTIVVKNPDKSAATHYFVAQGSPLEAINRAFTISGGLIGLTSALLSNADHPLLEATDIARTLLGQTTYQRLLAVEQLSKQRQQAIDVMSILQQMAHLSLQTASGQAAKNWQAILEASYQTSKNLQTNAQPKLALTNLMLTL